MKQYSSLLGVKKFKPKFLMLWTCLALLITIFSLLFYSRKPMSRYLENQKVKDGDCCEIALRDPILVSGNSEPETLKQESVKETSPAPSDSSADSSEEKPSSPNLLQKRSNFKVRSRSDSFCNEVRFLNNYLTEIRLLTVVISSVPRPEVPFIRVS